MLVIFTVLQENYVTNSYVRGLLWYILIFLVLITLSIIAYVCFIGFEHIFQLLVKMNSSWGGNGAGYSGSGSTGSGGSGYPSGGPGNSGESSSAAAMGGHSSSTTNTSAPSGFDTNFDPVLIKKDGVQLRQSELNTIQSKLSTGVTNAIRYGELQGGTVSFGKAIVFTEKYGGEFD